MSTKIRISPITRINGFWNLEIQVDGGQITDAWSSGIFFRGFEKIMIGRDPRDAPYFTERICGICSTAHAVAAAHAVEDALNIKVPFNAILLRNMSFGADMLQNHLRHFYLLTVPDFVRFPDRPPFVPCYESDYRLSGSETDRIMESYRQHFELARLTHEMVTLWGGKAPHQHGIIAGGFTTPPTAGRIQKFLGMLDLVESFVSDKMLPDLELLARRYEDYYRIGRGYGNLMSYGNFPLAAKPDSFVIPSGMYIDGSRTRFDPTMISEHVHNSWFAQDKPRHPRAGQSDPDPDKEEAYSWVKAPRYNGIPVETNPLAHLWMTGDYTRGISVMDRLMARVLEAKLVAGWMRQWAKELAIGLPVYQPYDMPDREVEGTGYTGAMRGGLGHWVRFKGRKILHYQIITPSSWYCSPRDDKGQRGPLEEALVGTPIADTANPIEVGRVARSFDPCLACAVHMVNLSGETNEFVIDA